MMLILLLLTAITWDAPASGQEAPLVRPGDSVWMVDTREVTRPTAADPGMQLRVIREGGWIDTDVDCLMHDSAPTRTVLFVHGYDFSPHKAGRMTWEVYHALTASLPPDQNLRFITWSWPSTAVKFRPLRDMKAKMKRADTEAYFLAWFLSRVNVDTVVGTSLGARVVSGSLQFLATDAPTLNTEIDGSMRRERLTAVLISAAIGAEGLQPTQRYGKALTQLKQLILINNSLDPLLANFSLVSPADADALGVVGLSTAPLIDERMHIEQHDVAVSIGKQHGVEKYLQSPTTRALLQASVVA